MNCRLIGLRMLRHCSSHLMRFNIGFILTALGLILGFKLHTFQCFGAYVYNIYS